MFGTVKHKTKHELNEDIKWNYGRTYNISNPLRDMSKVFKAKLFFPKKTSFLSTLFAFLLMITAWTAFSIISKTALPPWFLSRSDILNMSDMVGIEKPVHTEPWGHQTYPNIMKTSSVKHWLVRFNKNQSITGMLSRFFTILEEKYIISQKHTPCTSFANLWQNNSVWNC